MHNFSWSYQIPAWLQCLTPYYKWRGDALRKVVYLTFDDGPIPDITPRVLQILTQYNVSATFFMVGDNVARYPDIFRDVVDAGHAVGNHTYHHIKGWNVDTESYMHEVAEADKLLAGTRLFRPPYGKITCEQRKALRKQGYTICLWDVLTHDYDPNYTVDRMFSVVQRYVRQGSVINFHDSVKSADRMLCLLPRVIEWLKAEGYVFEKMDAKME